ncbi:uncharacterized protein LOC62_03G003664 [Vanrija pseudolonga]|uniref:Uncharacterized protein n=1 Tax=Vanrija pseudolonga TaxID=143232 RepID=A0AAF0Y8Z9_9TREE|nr:hypothetical protein LOC62_03G003664 [Vanrija pseudolonga]
MSNREPATAPARPHPKVIIDYRYSPEIMDTIVDSADRGALLALRATSKEYQDRADAKLFRHISLGMTVNKHIRLRDPCDRKLPLRVRENMAQHWSLYAPQVKHFKVIDTAHGFSCPERLNLPPVEYSRVHNGAHPGHSFGVAFEPVSDKLVVFCRCFPMQVSLKRMVMNAGPSSMGLAAGLKVVIHLLPGSFDFYARDTFVATWAKVPDLVIITASSALSTSDAWVHLGHHLARLLRVVRRRNVPIQTITARRYESDAACNAPGWPEVDDVLDPEFWRSNPTTPALSTYHEAQLGQITKTLRQFNVKCVTMSQYKATLTPEQAAAELVANSLLLS